MHRILWHSFVLRGFSAFVKITFAASWLVYWFLTIVYVSPNNYIKARLAHVVGAFEIPFYQKWEFFAPPPTFNQRVYALATLSNPDEFVSLDLMSEVIRRKKQSAPFNGAEDALDYVLFGAIVTIDGNLRDVYLDTKKRNPNESERAWLQLASDKLHETDDSEPAILVLRNYAISALAKQVGLSRVRRLRVRITKVITPKFSDAMRSRVVSPPQEVVTYETKDLLLDK